MREQLVNVAGEVFAENGFQGSTSREICLRAGTNLAAVNYHFGGFEALYKATLKMAQERAVWIGPLDVEGFDDMPPRVKLKAVVRNMVERLSRSIADSWEMRLLAREMVVPTFAQTEFVTESMASRRAFLKGILADVLEKPQDDPIVERCLLTVIAPCLLMSIMNRSALEIFLPDLMGDGAGAPMLVDHVERFVMAGIDAVMENDLGVAATP